MMKKLLILGAGGFGREVHAWLIDLMRKREDLAIVGFLDDNRDRFHGMTEMPPVVGKFNNYSIASDELLVCAVGDPLVKLEVWKHWKAQGASFFTLVHPTASIDPSAEIGEGCVLCPMASVGAQAKLGPLVALNVLSNVGAGAQIGTACTLSGHARVGRDAKVGEAAFLSSQAVVGNGVLVGAHAKIGAGTLANADVAAGATIFGVPARQIAGFN
jgi:sugar O-acyltransferase (sialic acid O-acetyltransferase NeuD family)